MVTVAPTPQPAIKLKTGGVSPAAASAALPPKAMSPKAMSPKDAAAPGAAVRLSVSKKYVLPPRPKPGRKPSAETPPNRRKAQNREAQRAFRERRAAAVSELEVRLGEVARKHAEEQAEMKLMIERLVRENEQLRSVRTPPAPGDSVYTPQSLPSPSPFSPGASALPPPQQHHSHHGHHQHHQPPPPPPQQQQQPQPGGYLSRSASLASLASAASPSYVGAPTPTSAATNDVAMEILDRVLDQKLPVPDKASPGVSPTGAEAPQLSYLPVASAPSPLSPGARGAPACSPSVVRTAPPSRGLDLVNTSWRAPAVPLPRRLSSLETDFTLRFKAAPGAGRRRLSSATSPLDTALSSRRGSLDGLAGLALAGPAAGAPAAHAPATASSGGCGRGEGCCKSKKAAPAAAAPATNEYGVVIHGGSPPADTVARPSDRCGFCTDDTPCLCAETAARDPANLADIETLGGNSVPAPKVRFHGRLPSVSSLESPGWSGMSPMSFGLGSPDTAHSFSDSGLESLHSGPPTPEPRGQHTSSPLIAPQSTGGSALGAPGHASASGRPEDCTGDPGNCNQCRTDPMSTLFCTTVASKPPSLAPITAGTFIPAQAAYRTLSRHKRFGASDFGTIIDSLETRGTQVEVNSVAKVLRMLDSRLYN